MAFPHLQSPRYNSDVPTFSVRLFAYLKDRHGEIVEVEADPTASSVVEALNGKGIRTQSCRLSVNLEFVDLGTEIREGDELALIPPVSGG
jgi:molybdopterin converting factor small subunit